MIPHKALIDTTRSVVRSLGVLSTFGVVLCFVLLIIAFVKAGKINDKPIHTLAAETIRQQHSTSGLKSNALRLQIAVIQEDWDTIDPLYESLINDSERWIQSHERNESERIGSISHPGNGESIVDLYGRARYPYNAMKRSLTDLERVTKSIIRRAPYIDQLSQSLLTAAVDDLIEQEPNYQEILGVIGELYTQEAKSDLAHSSRSISRSILFLAAGFVGCVSLGFIPRNRSLINSNRDLRSELESSSQSVDDRWGWVLSLSETLRIPFERIQGSLNQAFSKELNDNDQHEHREVIIGSTARALSLLDDVQELATLETQGIEIQSSTIDPRLILENIESKFQRATLSKGIELRVVLEESFPESIMTDPDRLEQILSEVVENAIAHTSKGSVEIHAALDDEDPESAASLLTFRVVDTGAGIESDSISSAFDPFHVGEALQDSGAGIGLAKARLIARALDGDLTLDSAKGAGCYATITINPGAVTAHGSATEPDEQSDDLRLAA